MSYLDRSGAAASSDLADDDQLSSLSAVLKKVVVDHDQIEQCIAGLRLLPRYSARLLEDLGELLADHYEFVAETMPAQWMVDAERAMTLEEDCAEVAIVFQHARIFDAGSSSAIRAVDELVVAIRWHIDAEEAALFGEAARFAKEAVASRLAS